MKRYTETEVAKIRGLDKEKIYFDAQPGLVLVVRKQKLDKDGNDITSKSWCLLYRPRGKSPRKLKLGAASWLTGISRPAAISRLVKLKGAIDSGQDPVYEKQKINGEITVCELVNKFYKGRLNKNYGYKQKGIEGINNTFNVWLLENTLDAACKAAIT